MSIFAQIKAAHDKVASAQTQYDAAVKPPVNPKHAQGCIRQLSFAKAELRLLRTKLKIA